MGKNILNISDFLPIMNMTLGFIFGRTFFQKHFGISKFLEYKLITSKLILLFSILSRFILLTIDILCIDKMLKSKTDVQCGVCKKTLKRGDNLSRHIKAKHPLQTPFEFMPNQNKLHM